MDLHIHSNHSDGIFTPEEIVEIAVRKKLVAISITDHDQFSAVEPAQAHAQKFGLTVVPGIEIDCKHDGYEVHILGYFIDVHNKAMKEYTELLRELREERAREILDRLEHVGIKIPFELVEMKANGAVIGRPHVADVLVEEGHVFSFNEAFYKYLGDNKPAFVPKRAIEPGAALNYIKKAGGLSFIAHPGVSAPRYVIEHLISLGLDGVEVYHPQHSEDQRKTYTALAEKYGLLISGGSDCHGDRYKDEVIGKGNVPASILRKMIKKIDKLKSL